MRPGLDRVKRLFCAAQAPKIDGLHALRTALGLRMPDPWDAGSWPSREQDTDLRQSTTNLAFIALSTSLTGRLVSPINPRMVMHAGSVVMAFQRGVQRIELASFQEETGRLAFYLVTFQQSCNASATGCLPKDLYTPALEEHWQDVVIQDDEDLKNTASDCRQCHQRGLERAVLLMRERTNPWTHFFGVDFDDPGGSILPDFFGMDFDGAGSSLLPDVTNQDLVRDFLAARGDESYGGVTTTAVRSTHGFLLERLVGAAQPVLFDTPTIYQERWGIGQGSKLEVSQRSPTWDRHYEAFKRGEQLALPHYTPRPTDPVKQAALTDAYARYRAGALVAEALPDLADIYPDDPQLRAEIGLDTELDATPAEALIQACGPCHNDVLDQSISRARFNVDLARLDQSEIALAVGRLKLAAQEPGAMPPSEARQLPQATRARLVAYLEQGARSAEDDAALHHAAVQGMAGGSSSLAVRDEAR